MTMNPMFTYLFIDGLHQRRWLPTPVNSGEYWNKHYEQMVMLYISMGPTKLFADRQKVVSYKSTWFAPGNASIDVVLASGKHMKCQLIAGPLDSDPSDLIYDQWVKNALAEN
jgi:hypothetical protein